MMLKNPTKQSVDGGLPAEPFYKTDMGAAYLGDALEFLKMLPADSVNLIMTSPPYALHFKKEYGNVEQGEYVNWFLTFGREMHRVLRADASLVIDIGGAWTPGKPTRSLYHFELLLRLCRDVGFFLAQEFYWYNPAKLPSPAEWVTVRRVRVKDAVECLWWLSKSPDPKADNRRVLTEYSKDMERLLKRGYRPRTRPSGHSITSKFRGGDGAIPPNVLIFGNNDATGNYMKSCRKAGLKPHPARFPIQLPVYFIRFLTDPGDVVVDPFAGSNTTGEAAEREGRRWLAFESKSEYLEGSRFRFDRSEWVPVDLSKRNSDLGLHQSEPSLFNTCE